MIHVRIDAHEAVITGDKPLLPPAGPAHTVHPAVATLAVYAWYDQHAEVWRTTRGRGGRIAARLRACGLRVVVTDSSTGRAA